MSCWNPQRPLLWALHLTDKITKRVNLFPCKPHQTVWSLTKTWHVVICFRKPFGRISPVVTGMGARETKPKLHFSFALREWYEWEQTQTNPENWSTGLSFLWSRGWTLLFCITITQNNYISGGHFQALIRNSNQPSGDHRRWNADVCDGVWGGNLTFSHYGCSSLRDSSWYRHISSYSLLSALMT